MLNVSSYRENNIQCVLCRIKAVKIVGYKLRVKNSFVKCVVEYPD